MSRIVMHEYFEISESDVMRMVSECVCRVSESLNNADYPLYHNTTMENLAGIMRDGCIKSAYHRGYGENGTHVGICFTRNIGYNPYTYYNVRMKFNVGKIMSMFRGLKLIPYQDAMFKGLDEYEERLVSSDGKPFVLDSLSEIVDEVVVSIDDICVEINENGDDVDYYKVDLANIFKSNIFGERLKVVDNFKDCNVMGADEALRYMEEQCEE